MEKKLSTRFRELLHRRELLVMSGGFSPLHARMSEVLGYEAFFMSGSQVCAYVYGYPDVGLLGLSEMAEAVRRLTVACNIPIFADADTGYGNAVNVYHTVQAYIRAGAAGLHIEDQEAPKKSGTLAGRRLISREEAIGKFKAAVAAKKELDPDFVICARCDSIGSEGGNFQDAVERSIAYVEEAGVDAIWVNTLTQREEIEEACRRIPAPVIAPYYGPRPSPTFEEFAKAWCRGGFVSESDDGQRAAGDLGTAPRVQGTRPDRARRVEQKSASEPMGHGAAHPGSDSAGEKDSSARRRVYSERAAA